MKRYTKWIPVHYYHFDSRSYIVFARYKSDGILCFKTKMVAGPMYNAINLELNFKEQINLLQQLELTEIL